MKVVNISELIEQYEEQDNCLYDFLEELPVSEGTTYGAALDKYVSVMHEVEGDLFYRYSDGELTNLVTGERIELPDLSLPI